ncbi:hypothetical protein K504DRAFT_92494 [Pleomassaria siparia CBS 279.74]|uniref:Uncharacterized protein n=1 Tax=Pleomassaria siparia CBS 279.74 TaxID=1314801 RepID=A0A6G1JZB4_9PLEO|nr:hypothetical protein K504DRAFT_92494 [Pleomassaria siparia CBS 279.74]
MTCPRYQISETSHLAGVTPQARRSALRIHTCSETCATEGVTLGPSRRLINTYWARGYRPTDASNSSVFALAFSILVAYDMYCIRIEHDLRDRRRRKTSEWLKGARQPTTPLITSRKGKCNVGLLHHSLSVRLHNAWGGVHSGKSSPQCCTRCGGGLDLVHMNRAFVYMVSLYTKAFHYRSCHLPVWKLIITSHYSVP